MAPSVMLRGEGGVLWEFDLPLGEVYAEQVRRGRLEPADDASAKLLEELAVTAEIEEAAGAEAAAPADAAPAGPQAPPLTGAGSGRDAWAAYAAHVGIEVTAEMKKAEIVAAVKAQQE